MREGFGGGGGMTMGKRWWRRRGRKRRVIFRVLVVVCDWADPIEFEQLGLYLKKEEATYIMVIF